MDIAFGLQEKFSWASVAASAVAAPIASKVGEKAGKAVQARHPDSLFATRVVSSLAQGAVNQLTYATFTGGRINYAQLIGDAFGNAFGNSLVDAREDRMIRRASELVREHGGREGLDLFLREQYSDEVASKVMSSESTQSLVAQTDPIREFERIHGVRFEDLDPIEQAALLGVKPAKPPPPQPPRP